MPTDPCLSCGAAMAADQRYCLACGERRAEARLDFLEILRGGRAATAGGPAVTHAAAADDPRGRLNLTVVSSIGCLLLAMGVGVLIGNAGQGSGAAPAAAPAAQVIRVQGGGTAAASTSGPSKSASAKRHTMKSSVKTAASASQSKATNPSLKALSNTSGKDYSKQSAKLPKTVATGGKAPPVDKSKPAGGGSGFQTIG